MKRARFTRRQLLGRAAVVVGTTALASQVAACRGTRTHSQAGPAARATGSAAGAIPVRGGALTLRSFSDASILDYAFSHDVYSSFIISNCVESLLTHDPRALPAGLLAQHWENPDGQTYVFTLRPGAHFQDGTSLTADAAAYSMNRIRNDKSSFHYQDLQPIDRIEAPTSDTVRITLAGPFAPFLEKLTGDAGRVISPAIAERYGKDRLKTDLTGQGTGPFKIAERKPSDHVTLVRNDAYWGRDAAGGPLPYLDKLTVRVIPDDTIALAALRAGEIDAFRPGEGPPPKDAAAVHADPSLSYRSIAGLGYTYIVFNEAKEPFNRKELRQAVCYAVDRAVIAKNLFFDTVTPLDVFFPTSIWAAEPAYHPYLQRDVGRAKQLLAQAGRPDGFSFTYLISAGDALLQQLAELLKDQLKDAGITMTIQPLEFAALTQALSAGEHQAGFLGWGASYDPDDWVYSLISTKGSLNARSHYANPEVDRLLDQARTTLDEAGRKLLYQQAQRIAIDEAVFCILYAKNTVDLTAHNVHNYPLGATPAVGLSQVWKTA